MLSPPRPAERWTERPWSVPGQTNGHGGRTDLGRSPGQAWNDEHGRDQRVPVKVAVAALVAALVMPFLVAFALYADYRSLLSGSLPPERPSVISGLTRIYDASGTQIALLREFDLNLPVSEGDIPPVLKQAVVAVEDRRFYSHGGVDDRAVLRAIWADLTNGSYLEGASTITQQYVRLMYLGNEKTLRRKIKEAALARRVEKELSKDQILYRYLDRAYFGGGAYGVGAAAQSFFRTPVRDLTLSQSALLAGLLSQPSVNEPRSNPAGAEAGRMQALDDMLSQRKITQAQFDEAAPQHVFLMDATQGPDGPATVIYPPIEQQSQYPYFVDYVRRYLVARYGDEKVYRGGLKVYTSLDPSLQAKAEKAVAATLAGTSAPLEMALVSVDPRTGLVRALVGGRDFGSSEVNLALGHCEGVSPPPDGDPGCIDGGGSGRQPGSAFKPFTLAKALEEGISPNRVYSGPASYRFPGCRGDDGCVVHNVESSGYGSLTLRAATAYSVNTVFAQLVEDVGVKDTAEMAHRLGLTMINPDGKLPSGEPYGPSLTLGAAEVSPLDMAAAYGVFANRGVQLAASPLLRVEGGDGSVLEDNKTRKGKRVLSADVADEMNDVLEGVVQFGTGYGADFGHPNGIAGKTGTSEDYGDAWFVGYTPQLSTAVWMGYSDSRKPLVNIKGQSRVYGATFGVPTWKAYMTAAEAELQLSDFARPAPPTTPAPAPSQAFTTEANPSTTVAGPTTPTTASAYVLPTLPTRVTPPSGPSPTSIYRAPSTSRVGPPTTRSLLSFPP